MADYRDFQVIIVSACNLKDVRHFGEMKVYAKVLISRNSAGLEWCTPVDKQGKTNPNWYTPVQCLIPEDAVQQEAQRNKLVIKLYCQRSLKKDKYIGEVNIFLKGLFDGGIARENVEYTVYRDDAQGTYGTLKLSYSFGYSTQIFDAQGQASSMVEGGNGRNNRRRLNHILQAISAIADGIQIGQFLSEGVQSIQKLVSKSDDEQEEQEVEEEEEEEEEEEY